MMNYLATALSILGAIFNAYMHVEGFFIWLVANALWIWLYWGQDWGLVILMSFYQGLCLIGIWQWRKKRR